jgi:type IV secretory pathway component VirB8
MFEILNTVFKYKEKASPDVLGAFPERVHVEAMPERRYLWASRLLVILSFLSICVNAMLASAIYIMLPQMTAQPRLMQLNRYFNQLEFVEHSEVSYPAMALVIEQYVRDYIMLRYMISNDADEMRDRWGGGSTLYWYSSPGVYQEFTANDMVYNTYLFNATGIMRDVEIDWVRPIAAGVWYVQFRTIDYLPGVEGVQNEDIWRATLRIGFAAIPWPRKEDAMLNPFGFMVRNFSLAYFGKPAGAAHYLEAAKAAAAKRR